MQSSKNIERNVKKVQIKQEINRMMQKKGKDNVISSQNPAFTVMQKISIINSDLTKQQIKEYRRRLL